MVAANPVRQRQIKFVNEWNSSTDYVPQVLLVPKAVLPVGDQVLLPAGPPVVAPAVFQVVAVAQVVVVNPISRLITDGSMKRNNSEHYHANRRITSGKRTAK